MMGADGLVKLMVRVGVARSAQGLDVIECRAKPVLLDLEVVAGLQAYPEPLRGAEVAGEPQGRVGADPALPARRGRARPLIVPGRWRPALSGR